MGAFEKVVQSTAEKLLEDERLRTNLDDEEADLLVNWAIEWLEGRISSAHDESAARQIAQKEFKRLRPAMQKINDALAESALPVSSDAAVSFGQPALGAAPGTPPDRKALVRGLIAQLAHAWEKP